MTETAADWVHHGGEYVAESMEFDFDVWPYQRTLGGWTIVVRQSPPNQMVEETGKLVAIDHLFTLDIAGGLVEHHEGLALEQDAPRVAWEDVPADIQAHVYAAAGEGWVWLGVDHRYDPTNDCWVAA